jgi:hypothetical protein
MIINPSPNSSENPLILFWDKKMQCIAGLLKKSNYFLKRQKKTPQFLEEFLI